VNCDHQARYKAMGKHSLQHLLAFAHPINGHKYFFSCLSGQSPERLLAMLARRQVPRGAAVPPHLGHGHSLGVLQADLLQEAIEGLAEGRGPSASH